jgi:AcrR family transcriptional regulator
MRSHDHGSSGRILLQALRLFSEKGYDAASVREVCEAAGITKPALYHHFGSKEGVFRALVEGVFAEMRDGLLEILRDPGTVRDRLKRIARGHFEKAVEQKHLMRFLLSVVYGPPSSAPVTDVHRLHEEYLRLIREVLEGGIAAGELLDAPTDARVLVFTGALGEAVSGFLTVGHPELTPDLADRLVDTVIGGWHLVNHDPTDVPAALLPPWTQETTP